MPWSHPDF